MRHPAMLRAAGVSAAFLLLACPQVRADTMAPPVDVLFAHQAAAMNADEIQLSEKALNNKNLTLPVKNLAQEMVNDHKASGDKLKQLDDRLNISWSDDMDSAHSNFADTLGGMNGADLERAYVQTMIMDHKLAITLYQSESKNGNNPDLKRFAAQTLPTLQKHLQKAQAAQRTIAGAGSAHRNGAQAAE